MIFWSLVLSMKSETCQTIIINHSYLEMQSGDQYAAKGF